MSTPFEALIGELGDVLGVKLKPDRLNVCRLQYPDGFTLQIEIDREETKLLLGSSVGVLAPGRFRQDVLEQALKSNTSDFHAGIFGYSKKTNELYLYNYLPTANLTAKQAADFIAPFAEKARHWIEALKVNSIPTLADGAPTKKQSGMFGLAP